MISKRLRRQTGSAGSDYSPREIAPGQGSKRSRTVGWRMHRIPFPPHQPITDRPRQDERQTARPLAEIRLAQQAKPRASFSLLRLRVFSLRRIFSNITLPSQTCGERELPSALLPRVER